MKITISTLFIPLVCAFLLTSCNIYDFTAASDDTKSLIEEGKDLLRKGDYDGAFDKFSEALDNDPNNSEIRYLHAKAAMRRTGVNTITIATEISTFQTESGKLPFMDPAQDKWPNERANALYEGILIANEDLMLITDSVATGSIKPKDIRMDLVVALSVNGILIFRDTNGDHHINENDIQLDVFFNNGQLNIKDLGTLIDSMDADGINNLIETVGDLLDNGGEQIEKFLEELTEDDDSSGINEGALDNVIDKIKNGANEYKIEIGVDNDHDGMIDEEYLDNIDNDGDARIDEDSNGRPGP